MSQSLDELPPLAAITDEDWDDDRWRQPRPPRRQLDPRAIVGLLERDPELSLAIMMPHDGGPNPAGPPPPGAMPPLPQAGPAQPGQSLADARLFLPPGLITSLAQMDKAQSAGQVPGPAQTPGPPAVR